MNLIKNKPICFGTFLTNMEKLRRCEYWKCNCPECPFRIECQMKESEINEFSQDTKESKFSSC